MSGKCYFGIRARHVNPHRTDSVGLALIDTAAFSNYVVLIRAKVRKHLDQSAGPANHDLFRPRRLSEAEMQPQVALRDVAAPAAYFLLALIVALLQRHNST